MKQHGDLTLYGPHRSVAGELTPRDPCSLAATKLLSHIEVGKTSVFEEKQIMTQAIPWSRPELGDSHLKTEEEKLES